MLDFAPGEDGKGTGQEKAGRVTGEGSAASFPAWVGDSRCKASGTGTGAASILILISGGFSLRHMCFGNQAVAWKDGLQELMPHITCN